MGTSDAFQSSTTEGDVEVRKSQKSSNDGICWGVEVREGGNGDARVSRPFDDGVGISAPRIRDLAQQYQELAYANAQANGGDTRTADCDAWLRRTLAEEGALPEYVKVEFERVMAEVFRV
jgi:hypothetical protein